MSRQPYSPGSRLGRDLARYARSPEQSAEFQTILHNLVSEAAKRAASPLAEPGAWHCLNGFLNANREMNHGIQGQSAPQPDDEHFLPFSQELGAEAAAASAAYEEMTLQETERLAASLFEGEERRTTWNPGVRHALISGIEILALSPNPFREAAPNNTLVPEAEETAYLKKIGRHQEWLLRYNESSPTQISRPFNLDQFLKRVAYECRLPANGEVIGFTLIDLDAYADVEKEALHPEAPDFITCWIGRIENGQRVFQTIKDPFPKGFPKENALELIDRAIAAAGEANTNHRALSRPGARQHILKELHMRRRLTELDLHDVSKDDIRTVVHTAQWMDMPDSDIAWILENITGDRNSPAACSKDTTPNGPA